MIDNSKKIDWFFPFEKGGHLPSQAPENIRPGKCWGVRFRSWIVEQPNVMFSSIGEIYHVPRTDDDGLSHERVKTNQSKGICFHAKRFKNLVTTGGQGYGKINGSYFLIWKGEKTINGNTENWKSIHPPGAIKGKFNWVFDYKQKRQFVGSKTACWLLGGAAPPKASNSKRLVMFI